MNSSQIKNLDVYTSGDMESIQFSFARHLKYTLAKDRFTATDWDRYLALSYTIRDFMIERWIATQQHYHKQNVKRICYLSVEYLMGRSLANNIINLGIDKQCEKALQDFDLDWEHLCKLGVDAGLGNGGLGRLAACFLESMATLNLPAIGYGLRYDYGIFRQIIREGYQVEEPDEWLRFGNPWEIERPEFSLPVGFGGTVEQRIENGTIQYIWHPALSVLAIPFDTPTVGYGSDNVNTLRLWSAKATEEFDFADFSSGDYIQAVSHKTQAENLTKVLYPNDNNHSGKQLRFRQQYFFVSCTVQDIIRRYKRFNKGYKNFSDKVAIQLNDTHPAMAIPELMHILVDKERLSWDEAWDVTVKTFGFTNHTLLPEALEKWPISFFEEDLPRHLQIIFEINRRFLEKVSIRYPGDNDKLNQLSIIEESPDKQIRMAYLATVGSHSVNGVAQLHTQLLKSNLLSNFHDFYPDRFNNKTNGVTQRRWLLKANPLLSRFITKRIGHEWIKDLIQLRKLEDFAEDKKSQVEFEKIKLENKRNLTVYVMQELGLKINPNAIFDVQIKRFHEYKRQLLNLLHIIMLYNRLKENPELDMVPRVFIFAGKAAPGYFMAKLIIKFINCVASVINQDSEIKDKIKIVFFPNYGVSMAESIIPATEVSEQISTAGMEASGTSNMKMTLNGALTLGTMDGANIEILQEVGEDNIFIFGLKAHEIEELRLNKTYNPWYFYENDQEIKKVIDLAFSNFFSLHDHNLFDPIKKSLLDYGDNYFLMEDFRAYANCQSEVEKLYRNKSEWNRKAILNVARVGKFSSDRVVAEYAQDIWGVEPVEVCLADRFTDTVGELKRSDIKSSK